VEGNVDISLVLFQVANDAMQMDLHKTLYPLYTTKKFPHESTRSVRIILKLYSLFRWSCIRVCEKVVLFVILQLLLNWDIIQCHYYCELHTSESELDFSYPQLRLWCSH